MGYDIDVKELPEQQVVSIRRTVPTSSLEQAFGEMLPAVWAYLGEVGVEPSGPPFGMYHGFDPSGETDLEAGGPVDADVEPRGEIGVRVVPPSRCAVTVHHGPYDSLGEAHGALDSWLHEQGHDHGAGPVWEVYWRDPYGPADPEAYRTEVGYPF